MILRMICIDDSLAEGPGSLTSGESYRIGRSSSCSFVLTDLSVSRTHAEITISDNMAKVKDLGSRNGTYVDGERIEEAEVRPGQSVRFGSAQFQFVSHDPASAGEEGSEVSTFLMHVSPGSQPTAVAQLSEAQKRVLTLLLEGKSEKEAASKLDISPHTVHNHVKEIYRKMNVSSRGELLALFVTPSKKPAAQKK